MEEHVLRRMGRAQPSCAGVIRAVLHRLVAEQGIKASPEHLPDIDAADDHAIAWTHQALRDRIEREGR